jgi:hypothetical protein
MGWAIGTPVPGSPLDSAVDGILLLLLVLLLLLLLGWW